ncbi:hypothetical protein QWZ13_03635 [Reinekea marina]|uniref:hypothetical protein n=1 Tax=Reinekea marina TaxID=1310421 RepID=UPI0025B4952E|nr:hypothetical protein [Reinekea marina]MDN3647997.1 hypothetical protein [Reinekea marina]
MIASGVSGRLERVDGLSGRCSLIHAPLNFAIHGSDTHSTHPHPQGFICCHLQFYCCVGAIEACGDAIF